MENDIPLVTTREMYEGDRPSDLQTWTMCEHLCKNDPRRWEEGAEQKRCKRCPESRPDDDVAEDERVVDGCRVVAEEFARFARAALLKEGWRPPE